MKLVRALIVELVVFRAYGRGKIQNAVPVHGKKMQKNIHQGP